MSTPLTPERREAIRLANIRTRAKIAASTSLEAAAWKERAILGAEFDPFTGQERL